jgi:hypothetical protein
VIDNFDKEEYWDNRKLKKRGQYSKIVKYKKYKDADTTIMFDDGKPVVMPRKYRRMKKQGLLLNTRSQDVNK